MAFPPSFTLDTSLSFPTLLWTPHSAFPLYFGPLTQLSHFTRDPSLSFPTLLWTPHSAFPLYSGPLTQLSHFTLDPSLSFPTLLWTPHSAFPLYSGPLTQLSYFTLDPSLSFPSFPYFGPFTQNSLQDRRHCSILPSIKTKLKTVLFSQYYCCLN